MGCPLKYPFISPARRHFHSTPAALGGRKRIIVEDRITERLEEFQDEEDQLLKDRDIEFTTKAPPALTHLMFRQDRQLLHYLRLIEHEIPKLVGAPKSFI